MKSREMFPKTELLTSLITATIALPVVLALRKFHLTDAGQKPAAIS